jgi:hypothetical protein
MKKVIWFLALAYLLTGIALMVMNIIPLWSYYVFFLWTAFYIGWGFRSAFKKSKQ